MSAYIIDNEGINSLVNSFFWRRNNEFFIRELKDKFDIDLKQIDEVALEIEFKKFGQLLVDLNQDSIRCFGNG